MPEVLQSDPDKIPCAQHPQEETRLRCGECETPVCPKCMVMYEVGFKCPACARKRPSHSEQLAGWQWATAGLLALAAGHMYGWLHPWLMAVVPFRIFGIPVLGFLLAYGLGRAAGNAIQRVIHYKLLRRLQWLVGLSAVFGLLMTPFIVAQGLEVLTVLLSAQNDLNAGTSVTFYLFSQGMSLLGVVFFVRGLCRPFWR